MYLANLKLWNFRLFGGDQEVVNDTGELRDPDLDLDFRNGLNVLIGENDTGKTAIVDAIKLVTNTHSAEWIRLTQEDFHGDSSSLRIECRFVGLKDAEAKNFTEWLCMDGEGDNSKPYLRVFCAARRTDDKVSYYDIRAGAGNDGQALSGESRDYLKAIFLKPLRDAESELVPRRNSRLSQILAGHDLFKAKNEPHVLVNLSNCFNCLAHKYFDASYRREGCNHVECPIIAQFRLDAISDGETLRGTIDKTVQSFSGDDSRAVRFGFGRMNPKIRHILEELQLSLSNEHLGLGSQNLLFVAAELLNLERAHWTGLRLGLVEEIEAHLHPQAQMRVMAYLRRIVEDSRKGDLQLILTTHSPNIGSKVPLDNLIMCHDRSAFPMGTNAHGQSYTRLEETDHLFLERFLDVTKANLFFARGVILVEGWAEEMILPSLAKKIGVDLTQRGISIVNVGSTALLRYARIFQRAIGERMELPVAVITDLDIKPDMYKQEDPIATTESDCDMRAEVEAKRNKYRGGSVEAFISPHWTLEYCLALSTELAPYVFEAVRSAIEEHRIDGKSISKMDQSFEEFAAGKSSEETAYGLYHEWILKKGISKAVLAQHLARVIDNCVPQDAVLNVPQITYLVDAIRHVAQ